MVLALVGCRFGGHAVVALLVFFFWCRLGGRVWLLARCGWWFLAYGVW